MKTRQKSPILPIITFALNLMSILALVWELIPSCQQMWSFYTTPLSALWSIFGSEVLVIIITILWVPLWFSPLALLCVVKAQRIRLHLKCTPWEILSVMLMAPLWLFFLLVLLETMSYQDMNYLSRICETIWLVYLLATPAIYCLLSLRKRFGVPKHRADSL